MQRMVDYMEDAEQTAKDIIRSYQKAMRQLNKEAETIFRTFQSQHHLTEAESRLLLKNAKGKTIVDKLKAAVEKIADREKKSKIKAAIDAPAYKWRIGRLEALQRDIDRQCRELYGIEKNAVQSHLNGLCSEAYNRTMFDIQKGTGFGFSFAQMPDSRIDEILKNQWSGENYSSRIWSHVSGMGEQLKDEMLVSFMTGRSAEKSAAAVAERFGVGASDARRLVRTESCYVANQAEMDSYKECGIEKYEFVAALDARTSEICRNMDGKVFPVDKQRPGVNAPPMHPYCRSTTIAAFDDKVTEGLQRRARNPVTGKNELIPADMTYREWEKTIDEKYGDGTVDKRRKMQYNESSDRKQFERYKTILGKNAPKTFSKFREIKYSDDWDAFKSYSRAIKSGELTPLADFDLYKSTSKEIDTVLVGKTASNGIVVSGKSNHFIARTIGSVEQKRNGVAPDDAFDAIVNPQNINPVKLSQNGNSQRFKGKKCYVTINPDTGMLIQTNPHKGDEG